MNIGEIGGVEVDVEVLDPDIIQRTELFLGINPMILVEIGRADDGVSTAYLTVGGLPAEGVPGFMEVVRILLDQIDITVKEEDEEGEEEEEEED